MGRITDYPAEITPANNDVMILDGGKGTRKITYENLESSVQKELRDLITDLTTRLNALADSDDETLDQLSEIVAYIKANRGLIDSITTSKVSVSSIVDDLITTATDKPLSANQGKVLREKIEEVISQIPSGGGGSTIIVDSAMSSTSENPVQNKVVKEYIDGKSADISADANNAIEKKTDGLFVDDKTADIQAINDSFVNVKKYQRYVNTELDYCYCGLKDDYTPVKGEIVPFAKVTGNLEVINGKIKIKPKETVQITVHLSYVGVESRANIHYYIKDITNNMNIIAFAPYIDVTSGLYEYADSTSCIYTNDTENDCEIGLVVDTVYKSDNIYSSYTTLTVTEIGRAITIDPVEYVNADKGIEDAPVGHIISYMGKAAPKHYLSCDGTIYNIADYPYLAEHIKTEFGSYNYFGGDGTTTFAVPDLRGEFLRGTGTNSHADSGNGAEVGEHQDGSLARNFFSVSDRTMTALWGGINAYNANINNVDFYTEAINGFNIGNTGATMPAYKGQVDTYAVRPTNTSVLYCIKYEPTYFIDMSTGKPLTTNLDINEADKYALDAIAGKGLNDQITEINSNLNANGLQFKFSTDGEGNYGYLGADDSFIPFKKSFKRTQVFSGDSRSGHTVDLTSYKGWQNFTLANFCISNSCLYWESGIQRGDTHNYILSDYDQNTGILTLNNATMNAYRSSVGHTCYIKYTVDLIE